MTAVSIWRDIPGWEGLYQASPLGHIRSMPKHGRPAVVLRERYARRYRSAHKDPRVNLSRNGKMTTYHVARLVALTWCKGYAPGLQVNHIDGDPLNNSASNLEWVTAAENESHAMRTGMIETWPVCLMHDGECMTYRSLKAASAAIGRNKDYINKRLRRGVWSAIGADGAVYAVVLVAGKEKAA